MPKTYGTVATFTAGSVLTAAQMNVASTAVNNLVIPAAASATRTAVQSINNVTWTFASFTSETFDTDGIFVATDTKFTIQTAGLYMISGFVSFAVNTTGNRLMLIEKNAASASTGTILTGSYGPTQSTSDHLASTSGVFDLALNDTIHLSVYQSSGGALNLGAQYPRLTVTWVGRTS